MRAIWKGAVSFGLVSIPVNLYVATKSKNIAFRQVHIVDGGRIQDKRICSVDAKEVPYTEVAKGYEMPGGAMVILTDDDLASLPVASSTLTSSPRLLRRKRSRLRRPSLTRAYGEQTKRASEVSGRVRQVSVV